ncbi:spore coat protein GerQ [Aquisalibacillus elongatus]|uniref:Spore coat protein GerQ n=1 Tax=Aquisalibacillus elongatus TaxID=485577 RepID=A0A3N5BWD1_9BACI|nr:spore coat protein GerQ [Aquisalibacillus elongatus]
MDQSKGKNQGGKLPDKKPFNNPGSKGPGKWSGGQSKWSGGDGKKMSLPGKGSKGGKMPGVYGGAQMGNNQGQMPGMVQGAQQGMMPNSMPGGPGMWQGGSGMGQGGQQGMMQGGMPGMMQGGQQGMMQGGMQGMPGMMQGGMPGGQQGMTPGMVQGAQQGAPGQMQGQFPPGQQLPRERSYIENILRLNRGKQANVYMSFEFSDEQQIFTGTIEEAGKDHIVVADAETGEWYLLLMIYLDYVVFDEQLEYQYPFG